MEIAFDPAKDASNRVKHGLSLAVGAKIFEDEHRIIFETTRTEDGETRFRAVGLVDRRLLTAVFVWRGQATRFISVRRSNTSEERLYRDPR